MDKLIQELRELEGRLNQDNHALDARTLSKGTDLLQECRRAMQSFNAAVTEGRGVDEVDKHVAWFKELLA